IQLEGVWTLIYYELGGQVFSCGLANPPVPKGSEGPLYIWNISREKMEEGPDNKNFPVLRYSYQLNAGGKKGAMDAMDLFPLDKDGNKTEKGKVLAILVLHEEFLIICSSERGGLRRPERLLSSSNPTTILYIFRRGKLK